ncbi:MAG: SUMF1/EgtB/PvdO family nonheme iron enzyme [Rhodospirillaceae bacterium]|nr:SUMF1/EgtB/PvdO family nonheme iron enzyme [Rhodospirillaceae bacterium]
MQAFAARDYVTAMRLMRALAEAGETSAQTYVAFMYKNGLGVDEDDAEAALWYRKAAEQDDALAQYSLGSMYEKGEGVPQSDVQAHVWYGIAAARFPASDREHIDKAIAGRTRVAAKLKPAQLAEAEKQAREWRPTKSAAVLRDCPTCPELVVIPAGRFAMGSPAGEPEREGLTESNAEDERPVHDVTIARPIAMGRYEITYGEFAAFAEDTKLAAGEKCWVLGGPGPVFEETLGKSWRDPLFAQAERQPVVCVNWDEAKAYADWLSKRTGQRYRLPTDAEWEYAARGGTTTARYWGDGRDQACAHANVRDVSFSEATGLKDDLFDCRDGFVHSAPVGSFKPNAFGLFDMIGNAAEWTADCHAANYRNATTDGTARPDKPGCLRAFRAGGFSNTPSAQRAANRVRSPADSRRSNLGFRVVREVAP